MTSCGKPELSGTSESFHACGDGKRLFLIEWRRPDLDSVWHPYGRTFTSLRAAKASIGVLRTWRNKHREPHEYRISEYHRSAVDLEKKHRDLPGADLPPDVRHRALFGADIECRPECLADALETGVHEAECLDRRFEIALQQQPTGPAGPRR